MQAILISTISGLCVAVPSIIATISTGRNNKRSSQENTKLITYRIDQLEKRVDKHNNVIDRTYKLEERVALLEDNVGDIKEKK